MKRKTKRIFSLLLALAVMATMLTALPLTGYAWDIDSGLLTITDNKVIDMSKLGITADLTGLTTDKYLQGYSAGWKANNGITVEGVEYPSALNVKDITARAFAIKVGGPCVVTAYGNINGTRTVSISTDYAKSNVISTNDITTNSYQVTTAKYTGTSPQVLYFYSTDKSDIRVNMIDIKFIRTDPTLSISDSELLVAPQNSKTLTATVENMGDLTADSVVWSSNNEEVATVENGVVTGVSLGTATITASITYNDITYSKTCEVTVSNSSDVFVTLGHPIKSLTLSQNGESKYVISANGIENIDFGTYDVSYENNAPMTYVGDNVPASLTVDAETTAFTINTKLNTLAETTFSDEVYEAISKSKSVKWGASGSTWYPTSFGYLNSLEQNNIFPVAGSVDESKSDSVVYATVQGGKIHSFGRNGNFQFNAGTKMTVPVVPGSTVTVINYSNDSSGSNNNVYTIDGVQVGTLKSDDAAQSSVYEYKYVYTGTENGSVEIVGLSGGYLSSVTVTPPTYTGIVLPDDMTLNNGSKSPVTITVSEVTEAYTDEYADVFGELKQYTKEVGYLNSEGNSASTDYTLVQDGVYKIYALANVSRNTNTFVLKKGDETILDNVSPAESEKLAVESNGQDVYVYSYVTGYLSAGTYNLSFTSVKSGASDLMALVMVPYDKLLGGETDSGKYTSADAQTKGVIRFLQGYTGVDVSGYGFYFVDGDGEIVKYEGADYKLESTAPMTGGFYGDLDAIPENYTNTYYAKPFVNIDGTMLYGDAIGGTVDWGKEVDYPEVTE